MDGAGTGVGNEGDGDGDTDAHRQRMCAALSISLSLSLSSSLFLCLRVFAAGGTWRPPQELAMVPQQFPAIQSATRNKLVQYNQSVVQELPYLSLMADKADMGLVYKKIAIYVKIRVLDRRVANDISCRYH